MKPRSPYLKGRRFSPQGAAWDEAVAHWHTLPTDEGAVFDRELHINAATLAPAVTWGTSPGMHATIDGTVPTLEDAKSEADRKSFARAYEYMDLKPGTPMEEIKIDTVFLGSCTTGFGIGKDLRCSCRRQRSPHRHEDSRNGGSRIAGG